MGQISREWSEGPSPEQRKLLQEKMEYIAFKRLNFPRSAAQPLVPEEPFRGLALDRDGYLGVIPVCSLEGDQWNVEVLSGFIGERLPRSAQLYFYQAQNRKQLLERLADNLIWRFATIAGGIGATPLPVADIIVLTPLQLILIGLIGGLSCRPFSKDTVSEYMSAAGISVTAAWGFRTLARQLVKLIPGFGSPISAAIAFAGTYAIGKAAKAYFFGGEIVNPRELEREGKEAFESLPEA